MTALALRRRRTQLVATLAVIGPGVIAANAGNDAGGIVTYASAGARFGTRVLFVMTVLTVVLLVVQDMAARIGAHGGDGLLALVREELPLPWVALALVGLVVANGGLVVSELAGVGAALELVGLPRAVTVPVAAAGVVAVVLIGSYRAAEKVLLALAVPLLAYVVAAVLARPPWGRVAVDGLVPRGFGSRPFLVMALALVGTTITPYMALFQTAGVAERRRRHDGVRGLRVDAAAGAVLGNLVAAAVIIATAASVGRAAPLTSVAQAADALRPAVGASAPLLFAAGLLGASLLAAVVVPLSTAYAVAEAAGHERSLSRRLRDAPLFTVVFVVQVVVGAAIALLPVDLVSLLVGVQVVNGVLAPVFLVFLLVLSSRRRVVGGAVNGRGFRALAVACVVVVGGPALVLAVLSAVGR